MNAKQLLEEALLLPTGARAALAGQLIQRLEDHVDEDAAEAWPAQIRRRLDQFDAGTAKTITWREARRRIYQAAGRAPDADILEEALVDAEEAARWYAERE